MTEDRDPIGWRLWWLPLTPNPPFHDDPKWRDYERREVAEEAKRGMIEDFGHEKVVVCVTPRYTRAYRRRQWFDDGTYETVA